jgi:thiol-disulfide isomerase/thioredoxin
MACVHAPELPQTAPWLNSQPLSLSALKGRIVLLDFWTYGCINCLHTLPDLKYLEHKYLDSLTVIGVHTAKFDHEKAEESVRQAVLRHHIQHPVVLDSQQALWQQYAIRAWPTFVLIDPEGYIVEQVSGEGHRERLDRRIAELVQAHQQKGTLVLAKLHHQPEPEQRPKPLLSFPRKVLADPSSNRLFIADTGHHRILVVRLASTGHANYSASQPASIQQIFGTGDPGLWDGDLTEAQFSSPQGMAFDSEHQWLYVADTGNHCLRKIDLRSQIVETVAGLGKQSQVIYPHSGEAREMALNSPWDLIQFRHFLLIAMAGSHQIWGLNLQDNRIGSFVGTGAEACMDGDTDVSAFAQPSGLATDGKELFVADSEGSSIRAVELDNTPQVRTICGSGSLLGFGDQDGQGEAVRLQHCQGLSYGGQNQLWIADTYNHKIKCVDTQTGICKTVLGSGHPELQDGSGLSACFNEPSGLSQAGDWLYIADTNSHAIRQVNLKTLTVTTLAFQPIQPAATRSAIHPRSA